MSRAYRPFTLLRPLLVIGLCLLLAACAGIRHRPEPPEVQLGALELTNLSLSHANFLATLQLYNPNSVSLDVEGINVLLSLNGTRLARGKTMKEFSLPAEGSSDAAMRLSTSYLNLLQLSGTLQEQKEISYKISGDITIGGLGLLSTVVPIDVEGILPSISDLNQLLPTLQPPLQTTPGGMISPGGRAFPQSGRPLP